MSMDLRLRGSAYLSTGVIDPDDAGKLAAIIVRSGHEFEMTPEKNDEGWRVKIQITLQGPPSIQLLADLRNTGLFAS